ncbi:fimbrial assembly protein [Lonsdalea iberica]|uniref:Fimbrial assembly protein n=2 Tax=Lonsdalea iberica TaxID=1082703 RepID=A0A1X3RSP9_9GAMM|nr:fimbrial assembly protein [Lonsdalea iberica]
MFVSCVILKECWGALVGYIQKKKIINKLIVSWLYCLFVVCFLSNSVKSMEFNTSVLDVDDRNKIDLSRFADSNYVVPGDYMLTIKVNNKMIDQRKVSYLALDPDGRKSRLCLDEEIVGKLALKPEAGEGIAWWNEGRCADVTVIPGVKVSNQIGMGELNITIPQAWMKYSNKNWTPPEQWDSGSNGAMLDYSLTGNVRRGSGNGGASRYLSSYGTAGFNLGAWRYRADYLYYTNVAQSIHSTHFSWDQFYAYRPLPSISADVRLGEMYLNTNLFDSFRFIGASLVSNENMLPPSLRGYAPEIRGVARTNATVTVMQNGRVIHEITVPPGPFSLQDLNSGVSGTLDVRITEEDGSVTTFKTEAASLPYLTRPGQIQYKLSAGRPSDNQRRQENLTFSSSEFSWGMNNACSLYGGTTLSNGYQSGSVGLGRNLYLLGAVSADITQSRARLFNIPNQTGRSFSVNWSKVFEAINGQLNITGYRALENTFMGMPQYIYTLNNSASQYHSEKERYAITLSENFDSENPWLDGLSTYLSYTQQTFWNERPQHRYGISLNTYLDLGPFKGVSAGVSAWRTFYNANTDDSIYFNLSFPLRDREHVGYALGSYGGTTTQTLTYNNQQDQNQSWNLSTRYDAASKAYVSGTYNYAASATNVSMGLSWQQEGYTYVNASLFGGITATRYGVAAHQKVSNGGTRVMVDTHGVADVPFSNGSVVTNAYGLAVIAGTSSYLDVSTRVDVKHLPADAEALTTIVQGTLTEGAIGYRKFEIVSGSKVLGSMRLPDGRPPPFGATVTNASGREVAMVTEEGQVYLTGVEPNETLTVRWDGEAPYRITLPQTLTGLESLLLPCQPLSTTNATTGEE